MPKQDIVRYSITVGSTKVDPAASSIVSVQTDKTINKIPLARITLHDGDVASHTFPTIDSNDFAIGTAITIEAGYDQELTPIFKGIIVKQTLQAQSNANPQLTIECRDAAYRTTLVRQHGSYAQATDSEAITKILSNYSGIETEIETTTVQHEVLLQQGLTDWDFINLRAEANGKVVVAADGTLAVKEPSTTQSPQETFTYGDNIIALELKMDARSQQEDVMGKVWASASQASEPIQAQEPGESSFGNVRYTDLTQANSQPPTTLCHEGDLAEKEMETLAASLLKMSRMAKIQGKLTVQGTPTLQPDSVVAIEKGAKSFQGNAYVSGVRHKLAGGQMTTELTLGLPNQRYMRKYADIVSLPAAGMIAPAHGLQVGIVRKITEEAQEEQHLYKVLVALPMLHTEPDEGIWCRIATFYASNEAGAFFMPEIGDEVVIGSFNDDPRSSVILGALYSSKNKAPITADKDNTVKTLVSRSKLTLTFDDENKEISLNVPGEEGERTITISDKGSSIEIINGKANKISLGKESVEISSNQDITLSANGAINLLAGKDATLTAGNAVEISGKNVTAKADMKASIQGASSAELVANSTTIVKGSMVKIN